MLDHEKMLILKAISELMDPGCEGQPPLSGIVELDVKFFGGQPRFKKGLKTNDSCHQAKRLGLLGSRLRWTNSYEIKAGKDMDYHSTSTKPEWVYQQPISMTSPVVREGEKLKYFQS